MNKLKEANKRIQYLVDDNDRLVGEVQELKEGKTGGSSSKKNKSSEAQARVEEL
jgi:hypothetical protein